MTTTTNPDGFRITDAPMARDRTPGCRYVRDAGEVFQAEDGTWVVTSIDGVREVLQHPELFSSDALSDDAVPLRLIPTAIDPPEHTRYRRALDPLFGPRAMNALEDDLRAQVRDLVRAAASNGGCDLIRDIAVPFPTQVFLTLLGLPLEDRDQLITWVQTIVENSKTANSESDPVVSQNAAALFRYLQDYIERKRARPGDDLLSHLHALTGDDAWSNEEILSLCFLLTLAGLDTVTASIGFVFLHLARRPELRRQVVADPSLVGPVIEEVLRLEPPSPFVLRIATEDVEVGGVRIPAGSRVMPFLATANRDPAKFESPDEACPAPGSGSHLTFGGGIHRCLGSHLARRELRLVVEEFHRLVPEYELAPGYDPVIVWPSRTCHLPSLPLVFPPVQPSEGPA